MGRDVSDIDHFNQINGYANQVEDLKNRMALANALVFSKSAWATLESARFEHDLYEFGRPSKAGNAAFFTVGEVDGKRRYDLLTMVERDWGDRRIVDVFALEEILSRLPPDCEVIKLGGELPSIPTGADALVFVLHQPGWSKLATSPSRARPESAYATAVRYASPFYPTVAP